MEIKKLSGFLEKFKTIVVSREEIKKESMGVVFKKTGIQIIPEHLTIKNNILFVEEGSAIKSVIFIHKQEILDGLKERLGRKAPVDIR